MMWHTAALPFTNREKHRLTLLWFGLFVLLAAAAFAFSAQAQVFGSVNAGFSCAGGGASGSILQQGSCPSSIEDGKIFSYFVCQMEKLIGETFGSFYCHLQGKFFGPMSLVITMAIMFFGIAFITGIVQATARDSMIFLFKVAAVWGFATQADLLIGVAYNFFMGGLKDGITIVVSNVFTAPAGSSFSGTGQGGQQIYEYMDELFKKFVSFTTESSGAGSGGGSGGGSESDNPCKNAVFAALALLMLAFPPLAAFGIFLFIKFVAFLLRAVFGYVYALIGISFLIVLAPIFLSFYFWRQTQNYFAAWVGHLAAFALQMVIIFSFIAFILSIDFRSVGKDLLDLVVPYNQSVETSGIRWPWKVCTICEFTVTDASGAATGSTKSVPGGSVKCKETPGKPIPPSSLAGPGNNSSGGDMGSTLLKLTAKTIITLVVLVYALTTLMQLVPTLAARLASAGSIAVFPLADQKLPGEQAFQTFEQQFTQRLNQGGNPVTAWSEAFTQASGALMTGARSASGGNVTSPGLSQMLQQYMWNGGT